MEAIKGTAVAILVAFALILGAHGAVRATDGPLGADEGGSSGQGVFSDPTGEDGHGEADFDIRNDIVRGQESLKEKVAGGVFSIEARRVVIAGRRGRKREKVIVQRTTKPNFLLAVEDLRERKIREVLVTGDGSAAEGFDVRMVRRNGVGSRFEIVYPENMVVLALRTTVRSGEKGFKEVVYTPYSPRIDTPEVRRAGLSYLVTQIELARADLERRRARLWGFERLSTHMPTDVSLALSIIEHIDPLRFRNCPKGVERDLVHEVLTIIGANTVNAYAYSRSPAGAMGLFQITPATYERLLRKYPRAGLTKDFFKGCSDHVNAAKASLLLFDSDLSDLPRERLSSMTKDSRTTATYLAAAYNCGSKRVQRSARQCGSEWTCRLPLETKIYLDKFRTIWDSGIAINE